MPPFTKNPWLLSVTLAFTSIQFLGLALETYQFIGRASVDGWGPAVRDSSPQLVLIAISFLAGCYAWLALTTQQVSIEGFSIYTFRKGRVTIPWSAVQFATFVKDALIIKTAELHLRIAFVLYRDRSALEVFLRQRLMSAGVKFQ